MNRFQLVRSPFSRTSFRTLLIILHLIQAGMTLVTTYPILLPIEGVQLVLNVVDNHDIQFLNLHADCWVNLISSYLKKV